MAYCHECGHEVQPGDTFCNGCGTDLSDRDLGGDQHEIEDESADAEPDRGQESKKSGPESSMDRTSDADSEPVTQGSTPDPVSNQERETDPVTEEIKQHRMSRRKQLALVGGGIVGVGVLGGAAITILGGGKPKHRIISGDAWSIESEQPRFRATLRLPKGRYAGRTYTVNLQAPLNIEAEITENGPIDVLTMPDDEYDRYRDRERDTQYLTELSELQTEFTDLSGELGDGDYTVVFDNTGVFGANPSGEAIVDVEMW
jgi:hypothetical protein